MQIFLKEVAKQILARHRDELAGQHLVFPNRRSALYFGHYLAGLIDSPVFSPRISTISELFAATTDLEALDSLQLVFKLFESYSSMVDKPDSFDEFFYWGEMIVNDFDDIDKYLVNHNILFQNLRDLREIDDKFGGLEPEVVEIIRKFWLGFDPSNMTSEKEDFLTVWDILPLLYTSFRDKLRLAGMAYEGMIMRDLVEDMESKVSSLDNKAEHFHFIGFNALNRCEKELLGYLKARGKASFYWDYDILYLNNREHEAGLFIRDNIKTFGQDLGSGVRVDNLTAIKNERRFEVYRAPSDVAQSKLIPSLLQDFGTYSSEPDKTAIILADENMLMPVVNSIPDSVESINVTMGYPLYQTPVYSLVKHLLLLQKNRREASDGAVSFYHADLESLFLHQYITHLFQAESEDILRSIKEQNLVRIESTELQANSFFKLLFSSPASARELNVYLINVLGEVLLSFTGDAENLQDEAVTGSKIQMEYLFTVIRAFKQLDSLLAESLIELGTDIYIRICDRLVRKLIIPFSGEPLSGLQVMGILETRALDFENILFLSVNEGVLPRSSAGSSYIPYNLRMAFGLPTVKHQDSIFAYYFYRLIQRASRVRFIYNSNSSGLRTGEMSRFLLQLRYSNVFDTSFIDTRFNIEAPNSDSEIITRTGRIQEIIESEYLADKASRILSPSALNTWIKCQLKFYYKYIAGLEETSLVQEEIDSPMFGNILHDSMNRLYKPWEGAILDSPDIEKLLDGKEHIRDSVIASFRQKFMRNKPGSISGKNLIIITLIENMISRILTIDLHKAPFELVGLEAFYQRLFTFKLNGKSRNVKLGGTIDRIDRKDGVIRILDYKSGRDSLEISTLESLSEYDKEGNSAAFQTLLYSWIYQGSGYRGPLRPSLYPARAIYADNFSDIFTIKKGDHKGPLTDFNNVSGEYINWLRKVLNDMFDPDFSFSMTTVKERCIYCSFANLCGRKDVK